MESKLLRNFIFKYYEKILFPIYHLKKGPTFGLHSLNILSKLNKLQWLPHEKIKQYQSQKLRRLIEHVYTNVPYYQYVMKSSGIKPRDIHCLDDLKYFPFLTKDLIRNNFHEIISNGINRKKLIEISTSGTTGQPLTFFRDISSLIWMEAARLRGWSWANYKLGDSILQTTTYMTPSLLGKIRTRFINMRILIWFANEDELMLYFLKNKHSNSFCIAGSASNLYRIATVLNKRDMHNIRFNVVFSTSEMLYSDQRNFLEKQFNSKVYDYYGCNEVGSLAYECEHNNKHISDEHVIFEVVDSRGENIFDSPGETTITDLDNYAMPFIRYKLGDVGTLTKEKCKCGRGLSRLKHVDGRTQDFLRTLDGNYVPSIFFPTRFRSLKGIEQYQIIQTDLRNITLKVVKNKSFSIGELEEMIRVIRKMVGDAVLINIEECSNMLFTGRGKSRLVISHVPKEF